MRVLILHSETVEGAQLPAQVASVEEALAEGEHQVFCAPFRNDEQDLREAIAWAAPQVVFNLVESVDGKRSQAHLAPRMLDLINMPYTGVRPFALEAFSDRMKSKQLIGERGLPSPSFALPPDWTGMVNTDAYIVKSLDRDMSFGLDEASVAVGWDIPDRAQRIQARHGGDWFIEEYLPGREFNIALLANIGGMLVLPIAEMRFANWAEHRPRIVGERARADAGSTDARNISRHFGIEKEEPELAQRLSALSHAVWEKVQLTGYAELEVRLDADGAPMILGIHPNPSLLTEGRFAAAALKGGLSYRRLIERIAEAT